MLEHKPTLRLLAPVRPGRRRLAGFTAIEVTAVATIIALMALVLIPIVRNRVEESKVVAAQDDLVQIEKAEMMAFGHTGHYFRLEDLVRPEPSASEKANYNTARLKVPLAYWDKPFINMSETSYMINSWRGPYFAIHRGQSVAQLVRNNPNAWRGDAQINGATALGDGPLMVLKLDDYDWENTDGGALEKRLYPVDPWGNPYIFFGTGKIDENELGGKTAITGRADFATAAVFSTGPNGSPGPDPVNYTPTGYYRELPTLGTGDDLKREF